MGGGGPAPSSGSNQKAMYIGGAVIALAVIVLVVVLLMGRSGEQNAAVTPMPGSAEAGAAPAAGAPGEYGGASGTMADPGISLPGAAGGPAEAGMMPPADQMQAPDQIPGGMPGAPGSP